MDFKEIANDHSKQFYPRFQEASEQLNPYWKRYSELNNRLDYLPLGSKDYAKIEKECEKAKADTIHGRLRLKDFILNMRMKPTSRICPVSREDQPQVSRYEEYG